MNIMLYAHKFDNLDEMDHFLEGQKLPKWEIDNIAYVVKKLTH